MLQLINVKKIYRTKAGEVAALDGVDLLFPETGMVFVTGKSGSGKTTLLNVVGGLDGIDSGEILVYGKKFSEFTADEYDSYRNTLIGFIFQEYNLLTDYNIEKNVGIADELQGKKTDKAELERVLASVGIENFQGRKPGQLSGGQKQRVAIARALIKNPKIIMADEPTGALDSATGIQVIEELKRLSREKLVIVISHDLELAKNYADRIIRLVDGKVVEDVTINEKVIENNVLDSASVLTVKSGSELTATEKDVLAKAVKERKPIVVTDNPTIKEENKTDESKIEVSNEKVKLIKSKMKLKSSAMLGVKSLKVKPLRLAFTILLSAIAFAVFGVFDTIASYSRSRVVEDFLINGDFKTVAVSAEEKTQDGESYNINLSYDIIATLKNQTGYNFKPVYGVQSFVSSYNEKPVNNYLYDIKTESGAKIYNKSKGKGYYVPKISGVVEFSSSERNEFGDIPEYGYKLLWGKYPELERDAEGNVVSNSIYQVAISKYLADCIWYHAKDLNDNPSPYLFGSIISEIKELLEKLIMPVSASMTSGVPAFEIVGIYDTGEIPSKYDILKDCYVKSSNDPNQPLIDELESYLASGAEQLLFVPEGAINESIKFLERPRAFYLPPATYEIKNEKLANSAFPNKSLNEVFYTPESAKRDSEVNKVMFFDPEREAQEGYTLNKNEALIMFRDIGYIFERERALLYKVDGYKENGNVALNNLVYSISVMGSGDNKFKPTVIETVNLANKLYSILKGDEYNPENLTSQQKDVYYSRKVTINKTLISTSETSSTELKIVGIYFDVSYSHSSNQLAPLIVNEETLSSLGCSLNQGHYQRAIAPMKKDANSTILANYITSNEGFALKLYGNNVLSTLEFGETQILQFTNLFLYASLVLALFSMFMLFNYISTSIVSKRNSIGILRALGSNSSDVFKMFLTESLIISVISGLLACVLSYFACVLVNGYIKDFMSLLVNFAIYGGRQIIIIFATSIISGVLASIIPIIKIAREKPVDLIRRP